MRGVKNYLPPSPLIMGFTFVFRLADDSLARHAHDRTVTSAADAALSAESRVLPAHSLETAAAAPDVPRAGSTDATTCSTSDVVGTVDPAGLRAADNAVGSSHEAKRGTTEKGTEADRVARADATANGASSCIRSRGASEADGVVAQSLDGSGAGVVAGATSMPVDTVAGAAAPDSSGGEGGEVDALAAFLDGTLGGEVASWYAPVR